MHIRLLKSNIDQSLEVTKVIVANLLILLVNDKIKLLLTIILDVVIIINTVRIAMIAKRFNL